MQDNRIQATLTAEEAIDFIENKLEIKLLNYLKTRERKNNRVYNKKGTKRRQKYDR